MLILRGINTFGEMLPWNWRIDCQGDEGRNVCTVVVL